MAFISGSKNDTARIIIIDETDWSIESNTVVNGSGEYYVDGLNENNKTIIARDNDGNSHGFGNVVPGIIPIAPTFGIQFREVETDTSWNAVPTLVNLNYVTDPGGNYFSGGCDSIARGGGLAFFCTYKKETLHGNKIQIDWSNQVNGTLSSIWTRLAITDGKFDRNSFVDFPRNVGAAVYVRKGAGDLIELVYSEDTNWSRQNFTSGILDMSASTSEHVTLMLTSNNGKYRGVTTNVWDVRLLSPTNEVISVSEINDGPFVREVTNTENDRGRIGTPVDL
jgi:hypothetical protein